jgi:hypothetical protein
MDTLGVHFDRLSTGQLSNKDLGRHGAAPQHVDRFLLVLPARLLVGSDR